MYYDDDDDLESTYYDEHSDYICNSYAYQEEGFSEDEIEELFDGDPDCYWNID